jgi:hypothetical protein
MKVEINDVEYEEGEYVVVEAICYDSLNKSEEPLEEVSIKELKLKLREKVNLKKLEKYLVHLKKFDKKILFLIDARLQTQPLIRQ